MTDDNSDDDYKAVVNSNCCQRLRGFKFVESLNIFTIVQCITAGVEGLNKVTEFNAVCTVLHPTICI